MKKCILLMALATGLASSSYAQISFGIKGGLNIAKVLNVTQGVSSSPGNTIAETTSFKLGPQGGIYLVIPFGDDQFAFQPEVLYSMKGFKYEYKQTSTNYESLINYDATFGYIEIPLNFRYKPSTFVLTVGPYIGIISAINVKTKTSVTIGAYTSTTEGESSDKSSLSSFDMGANLGLGLETDGGFNFGGRFGMGFVSTDHDDTDKPNLNMNIQVYAGFTFGGSGRSSVHGKHR